MGCWCCGTQPAVIGLLYDCVPVLRASLGWVEQPTLCPEQRVQHALMSQTPALAELLTSSLPRLCPRAAAPPAQLSLRVYFFLKEL